MRQYLPNRLQLGDEADKPDITAATGTRHRKLLAHPRQQLRPGNSRRVVRARSFTGSVGGLAAVANCSTRGIFTHHSFRLLREIANRHGCHGRPQRAIRCKHPVIAMPMTPGWWNDRRQPIQKPKRAQVHHPSCPGPRCFSVHAPARPSRLACTGAGHSKPAQVRRLETRCWRLGVVDVSEWRFLAALTIVIKFPCADHAFRFVHREMRVQSSISLGSFFRIGHARAISTAA